LFKVFRVVILLHCRRATIPLLNYFLALKE